MENIIFARWATDDEVKNLYGFFKQKNQQKNSFTNNWLAKNGKHFLELHDNFEVDFYNVKYQNYRTQLQQSNIRKINDGIRYNQIRQGKNNECQCGGVLKIVDLGHTEFVGCSNYRNKNVDHTKVYNYKPVEIPDFFEWFEMMSKYESIISSSYINDIKRINNLPKELKVSLLVEYLLMNNVELLHPKTSEIVKILPDIGSTSKKRENIILPILNSIFPTVAYQKVIYYKLKGEKPKYKIIDFLCHNKKEIFLFEQKKSPDDASIEQIYFYERLINYITKSYKINKYFIFETMSEGIEYLEDVKCLTINNIQDEFCR